MAMNDSRSRRGNVLVATVVHLYTALGAVLGFIALVAVATHALTAAFLILFLIMFIDYTDGTLARKFHVRHHLELIDGGHLDHLVDFFTNCILPLFLLWSVAAFPSPRFLWATIIIIGSLFRFSKTLNPWIDEGFFTGLPSPWVPFAFYSYYWQLPQRVQASLIIVLAVMTIIPVGYIHIARNPRFRRLNLYSLAGWWCIYVAVVLGHLNPTLEIFAISLIQPFVYIATSYFSFSRMRAGQ